jgi:shikimate kinase
MRPILADQANLRARYERRLPLYRMAHISVTADEISPEEVVEAVVRDMALARG